MNLYSSMPAISLGMKQRRSGIHEIYTLLRGKVSMHKPNHYDDLNRDFYEKKNAIVQQAGDELVQKGGGTY